MPGLAFPWSSKIKAVGLIWGNSSMVERSGFNSRFFRYIFLTMAEERGLGFDSRSHQNLRGQVTIADYVNPANGTGY